MTGFPCIKPTVFMSFILQCWVINLLSVGERTPCLPHQLGFHSLLWEVWSAPKPASFWDHLWVYKTGGLWVGLAITKLSGFVYKKLGRSNQRAEQQCWSALMQHRCEQQVEDVRGGDVSLAQCCGRCRTCWELCSFQPLLVWQHSPSVSSQVTVKIVCAQLIFGW